MILHQFKKLSIRNLGPPTTGKHITFQLPKKETPPLRPRVDSTVPRPTRFTEGGKAVIGQVGHGVLAIGKGEWQNEQWLRSTHCWLMMN